MPPSAPDNNTALLGFVVLLIVAGLTSYYAEKKGRNPAIWFVIGILLGFFAPIILFFLPSYKATENDSGVSGSREQVPPPAPPLRPSIEQNKLWFYLDANHKQYGPVSMIALKELWDTGQLELTSYVWSEGMGKWDKVDNLPDLKKELSKVQY